MKRRNFLQTLLGFAGTTALPANSNIRDQRQIEPLKLRRAPENKYDKRAVEVYWNNNMLGHIPKVANMSISQILDNSGQLNAKITLLRPQQKPWYCVDLVVYLDSDKRNNARLKMHKKPLQMNKQD